MISKHNFKNNNGRLRVSQEYIIGSIDYVTSCTTISEKRVCTNILESYSII